MRRLMVTALCAGVVGSAIAAEAGQAGQEPASAPALAPPAASAPAVPEKQPPAAATPPAPAAAPPAPIPAAAVPTSRVPPEKRKGADATQCLELKTDREIAACAEKFR